MKNVAMLTEDGVFALFFSSPPPGICHPRQKKNANAEGQGWGEGLDTAGIDRCITLTFAIKTRTSR